MGNFNLTNLAVNMYCPGNVAQLDDAGLPSLMVWIPAFRLCDVLNTTDESIHPAFIVNGVQIPGFWYSKYENVVHNGRAYSLPGELPHSSIKFDSACENCEGKGYGWHMSTNAEWAALALWCKKNGLIPRGNNIYGRDDHESEFKAIPANTLSDGKTGKVATGTGPLTWSHNKTMSGVWDMNGNVAEWQAGIRLVWGEIQILANNDAADPDNPQNQTSTCWKAINAADGTLVDPESKTTDSAGKASGNTVKLDIVGEAWAFSKNIITARNESFSCAFGDVTADSTIGDGAKLLLRALALMPDDGAAAEDYQNDFMYCNNAASECNVQRGASYAYGKLGGLFCVNGSNKRTYSSNQLGFRAAYIQNI